VKNEQGRVIRRTESEHSQDRAVMFRTEPKHVQDRAGAHSEQSRSTFRSPGQSQSTFRTEPEYSQDRAGAQPGQSRSTEVVLRPEREASSKGPGHTVLQ
jgi:hypothetical protein